MLKCVWLMEVHSTSAPSPNRISNLFNSEICDRRSRRFRLTLQVDIPARSSTTSRIMADTPILLREQQYHQIKAVLARLRMDSSAKVVFLVDKDGQEIASQGEVGNLYTTSLTTLGASDGAANGGTAAALVDK